MKKETMLKKIAQKGYDVSYAANLNFATYDIVTKIPSVVSFLSIAIGIFGLVFESFRVVGVSVCILLLGIVSLYIERFTSNVDDYCKRGSSDTELLYRLKNLYFKIKDSDDTNSDFTEEEKEYEEIEKVYNNTSSAKQILFANWFAHFKMFIEKDYKWMDEQLHFGWWKDKTPGSLKATIIVLLVIGVVLFIANWCDALDAIKSWFMCNN